MSLNKPSVLAVLYLGALLGSVTGQNVFVLPTQNTTQPVYAYSGEPFASLASFNTGGQPIAVFSNPGGTRFYVISKSPVNAVTFVDNTNFQPSTSKAALNYQAAPQAAGLSPDGSRLIVLADTIHVIDTSTDTEVASIPAPSGTGAPADVSFSLDSSRAYILGKSSGGLANNSVLFALDLRTNTIVQNAQNLLPGFNTTVATGPNGLIYATAQNRIYEIDPITLTTRNEIPINALPGRPVFTPDGKFAIVTNATPITSSHLIVLDLDSKKPAPIGFPNLGTQVSLTTIVPVGGTRLIALGSDNRLYDINLSNVSATQTTFGSQTLTGDILALIPSAESPTPRYLYMNTASFLARYDLSSASLSGAQAVSSGGNTLAFTGAGYTGTVSSVQAFNGTQTAQAGTRLLPLVVRVLDPTGKPLYNVPVTFSASDATATLSPNSTKTNLQGYAEVFATAPTTAGQSTLSVSVGGGNPQSLFTITATGTATGGGGAGGGTGGGGATSTVSIVSGNGQMVRENFVTNEPMTVLVKDVKGNPIPNAQVTYTITSGSGTLQTFSLGTGTASTCVNNGTSATCVTDATGAASISFLASNIDPSRSFGANTITAAYGDQSVAFNVVTYLSIGSLGQQLPDPTVLDIAPAPGAARNLTVKAGQTVPGAIAVQVVATGGPASGQPIPGIGIELTSPYTAAQGPTATCVGMPLSDANGIASCDLKAGGKVGVTPLTITVGGQNVRGSVNLTVTPGDASTASITSGNNQKGNAGTTLPLPIVAVVTDAFGNVLPGVQVTFQPVNAGAVTLANVIGTSDYQGRVSANVRLGSTPGDQQIQVKAGNTVLATFTVTINANFGALTATGGNNQTALVGAAFAPLTVKLTDTTGAAIPNVAVNFAVTSGSATLSAPSANTNTAGEVTVTPTAGATAGPIVITATAGNLSATFNLTSRLPGPVLTLNSFRNGASFQQGVVPCGIVSIIATGLAPNLRGVITPASLVGALPTTLSGVTVTFGGLPAPIYAVSNVNGQEQVTVQAPCELTGPGTVSVTVDVSGASSTVTGVPVLSVQPGIFETSDSSKNRFAVVLRSNGSFVSPSNPATRGETVRVYLTGLGAVSPATGTNRAGLPNQLVNGQIITGVNGAGVPTISSEYVPGAIGLYTITFQVPADAPTGSNVSLNFAEVGPDGQAVYSNDSTIAIQ